MSDPCVVYTRISSDTAKHTDAEGMGVERQEQDCRALADRLGWSVAAVFSDNDLSAYTGRTRPGFETMLDGIKRGEFDGLICWNTDRLIRRMDDLERLIEACDTAGVTIKSVTSGELDVSTANGKMLARMLGAVARQESEHKSERQKRANVQRAQAGGWWSSHRVFGYEQDGTIRESEAKLIRKAAADVLAGVSVRASARAMNETGSTTVAGKPWNNVNLKRLLMNPRHAGLRVYNGAPVGAGAWEPIIDRDTHHGLVAILSDASRSAATVNYERRYIGSRRYRCGYRGCACGHSPHRHTTGCRDCGCGVFTPTGQCGAVMQHTMARHADGRVFHRYGCTVAAHLSRAQPELDAYVESVAVEYLRDQKNLHKILAASKAKGVDTAELVARRNALKAQKDELAAMFTEGVLDGAAVRREAAKIQLKIDTVDAALAAQARRSPLAELLSEGVDKLDARWADASPDIKGKILDELFTVTVNPAPYRGGRFNPDLIDFDWRAQ